MQTFADLGVIGLALTLALLVAWALAAARPLAPRVPWSALAREPAAERRGLVAVAIVVVVFGIQSALDWTWYFPGVAVPALICAGWLTGRGPLDAPVGRTLRRRSLLARPGAGFTLLGLATVALLGGWLMWQPLRSVQQISAAETATTNPQAFAAARSAASSDPLSYQPLLEPRPCTKGPARSPRRGRSSCSPPSVSPRTPPPGSPSGASTCSPIRARR